MIVSSRRYTKAPYPPLRGPPSPMGKAAIREYCFSRHNAFPNREGKEEAASPPKKEANLASLHSAAPSKGRGSRGHSLLPMEGGAPKGRRLDGGKRYERERGRSSQVRRLREYPIHRFSRIVRTNTRICGKRITTDKAFPAWGRWRAKRAG